MKFLDRRQRFQFVFPSFPLSEITFNVKGIEKTEPGHGCHPGPTPESLGEDASPPLPQSEALEKGRPWPRVQMAVTSKLASE